MLPNSLAHILLALALQGGGAPLTFKAATQAPPPEAEHRLTLDLINDGFASIHDEGYSSGIRLLYRIERLRDELSWGRALRRFGVSTVSEHWTFGLAHEIWTPADLSIGVAELLQDDRPYAGMLSGEWYTDLVFQGAIHPGGYTRLSTRLLVGATGDWSFAEPLQRSWHSWVRSLTGEEFPVEPEGWDVYTVPETILVNLRVGTETEVLRSARVSSMPRIQGLPFEARAALRADCDLGTMRIGCEVGMVVRLGWMPQLTFDGASPIVTGADKQDFSLHLFMNTRLGVVLFDALLDGPLGTDSPTGHRRVDRGHFEIGLLAQLWGLEASYAYIAQTYEQTPLPKIAEPFQQMGHVRLSYSF